MDDNLIQLIRSTIGGIKKPVRLVLFTSDAGCEACPDARLTAAAIRAHAPQVAVEQYDLVMDRDKTDLYGIKRAPALVVQNEADHQVTFYGRVADVFFTVLLDCIRSASEKLPCFSSEVRSTLRRLTRGVRIQVFVEADCPLCRPVAQTAIGLAMESKLILTDIVIASDYPDLLRKHGVKKLPKTIFGENLHMDGHVAESTFLEMIFQAEGLQPGQDRRCLICSKVSEDIICVNCKNRIQAESLVHKIKEEHSHGISSS